MRNGTHFLKKVASSYLPPFHILQQPRAESALKCGYSRKGYLSLFQSKVAPRLLSLQVPGSEKRVSR